MRETFEHRKTAQTIQRYLFERTLRAGQIIGYMLLMHGTRERTTRAALTRMTEDGRLERVDRGMYRLRRRR